MTQSNTLQVIISLKDSLSSAMSGPLSALKTLGSMFGDLQKSANIALFAIKGALILLGKEAVESAMHITRLSRITGIGTQSLQQIGAAANVTGANFDRLSTGMKLLAEKAEKAAEGNKGFYELFNKVGLAVNNASGEIKNAEQLFMEFADIIANTSNPTTKMALAVEFLGRSGEELLPMLDKGSDGIRKFGQAANAAGMVMSKETVVSLDILGKQLSALKTIAINMAGEWLAHSGITIPKIIDLFVSFATTLAKIVAGWKIIFMNLMETTKLVAVSIGIVLSAIGDQLKQYVFELLQDLAPKINTIVGVLVQIKALAPEVGMAVALGMAGATTAFSKFDKDAISKLPTALGEAMEKSRETIENKGKLIAQDTEATIATLKESASSVQDYMKILDAANRDINTGVGGTVENMYNKIHTFSGGFAEATKEFIRNSGDWKAAWLSVFDSMESGISGVMTKFITEGGKMKDFMKELFKSIEQSFVSMITKMLTQKMLGALLGLMGGGDSTSAAQNQFSQGSSAMPPAAQAAMSQAIPGFSSMFPQIGGGGSGGGTPFGMADNNGGLAMASLAGLGIGASTAYEGVQHGNVTHGVVGGLAAGAALGTMIFPGIGTAIGAVIGGLAGYFTSSSAKARQRKQEEEARQAQLEQERQLREQARILLAADIRGKYGGGLADITAVSDIGEIMSGGITDATLDQLGSQNILNQGTEIGTGVSSIQVGSPNITVNATIAGSYDAARLAQDLGIHLASSIRTAAAGAGI